MRQPGLGKLDWVKADKEKSKKSVSKIARDEAKESKPKAKKK